MNILFSENALLPNKVDEAFVGEYNSARENGFDVLLYNFEEKLLRKPKKYNRTEIIVYRGWMLTPIEYERLYNDLLSYNLKLINNPTEYKNCHYLPDSLKYIENYTPKTIFRKFENKDSISQIVKIAKVFNGKPVTVKDYVKSEKHYWNTACFVENSNDEVKLTKTIDNFMELRGDYLNEGIVIREFVALSNLTKHSKSGMPLSEEYRLFFFGNELLCIYNYWEEGTYHIEKPSTDKFEEIAKTIENNLFTLDIAKGVNGNYLIIELGDGQVAGIPENENLVNFYKKLKERQYEKKQ